MFFCNTNLPNQKSKMNECMNIWNLQTCLHLLLLKKLHYTVQKILWWRFVGKVFCSEHGIVLIIIQNHVSSIIIHNRSQNVRYLVATEVRNNNIAAIANIRSCARYLGDKIQFPYCKEEEMQTLERATQNIYIGIVWTTLCEEMNLKISIKSLRFVWLTSYSLFSFLTGLESLFFYMVKHFLLVCV